MPVVWVYRKSENLLEENQGPLVLGIFVELLRGSFLNDLAFVHEDDPVPDFPGKAHLMGDADHCHAFLGQGFHDIQDLASLFVKGMLKQTKGHLVFLLSVAGFASRNHVPILMPQLA